MKIEQGYTELKNYTSYSEYEDANIYEIGADRSVPDVTCEIMRGDTNSQYITFQMPRYYDGIDLTSKNIMVRWYNADNVDLGGSYADICDARYNEEYVRFAWLLDYAVTAKPGAVVFTFQTVGSNEVNNSYIWKTAKGRLTILDNMENGAGGDQPTEDWFTNLMARIDEMYRAAETAENAAARADEATEAAQQSKKEADTATVAANQATTAASKAAETANTNAKAAGEATTAANKAAEAATTAAEAVFTDRNFLLKRNNDNSLTLVYTDTE